jgi:hypothetical protein
MSCSYHYYVIIPQTFNFDEYLSISEHMGINIDIKEAKRILNHVKNKKFIHCQDTKEPDNNKLSGFDFAVKVLEDLDLVIEDYEDGSVSYGDWIYNISGILIRKKELITEIFKENSHEIKT